MNEIMQDLYRITGEYNKKRIIRCIKYDLGFRFMYFWRKAKSNSGLRRKVYSKLLQYLEKQTGIEIPLSVDIGGGLQMIHPYNITINSNAIIGKNCVLLKGCTIGNVKCGKRVGVPVIGDDFYLGLNSTVVGGIKIGDDVLVAANTYVNFNVPSHSIVIGSPGFIHHKDFATKEYINNRVE